MLPKTRLAFDQHRPSQVGNRHRAKIAAPSHVRMLEHALGVLLAASAQWWPCSWTCAPRSNACNPDQYSPRN
jgi:hypothetical protein